MIHLDGVPIWEEPSATKAYSPLSLEEGRHPASRQRAIASFLGPIPQIAIIGTGCAAHSHMRAGAHVSTLHEVQPIRGCKHQPACCTPAPVLVEDPPGAFVFVASARPMSQRCHQLVAARGKNPLGDHCYPRHDCLATFGRWEPMFATDPREPGGITGCVSSPTSSHSPSVAYLPALPVQHHRREGSIRQAVSQ
jgi:hypothetical protein